MNSKVVFIALLAFGCCVAFVSSQIVGGLHETQPADDEVRNVLNQIREQFENVAQQKYNAVEPITYRKQVVAGQNYFIKVLATAQDGTKSHHHLRIYKPFKGPLELTATRLNVDEKEKLLYFM